MTTKANDASLESWVKVASGSDFPIQNLPFGICAADGGPAVCSALGDYVIDLAILHETGYLTGPGLSEKVFRAPALNPLLALGRPGITRVRDRLSALFRKGNDELARDESTVRRALRKREEVVLLMPVDVPDYTDFYSSLEHASNVGSMFRDPANPLLPNWRHLPVAYHGRSSTIVVSGTPVIRPKGQIRAGESGPVLAPTQKLDFELEVAFISCGKTAPGESIAADRAEEYIAGMVLFNDWSARDIQQWEYVPLGPFLGKNFASSISPWLVTMDALEPFRCKGPEQEPPVLPYLRSGAPASFDLRLQALLGSDNFDPLVISRSNHRYLYWNIRQQLAHHTINGCAIRIGDMFASGTISGPSPGSYGSMLELSWNGNRPMSMPDGTVRLFLEDGDTVTLRGHAEANGVRIGFGECSGKVLPART